MPGSLFGFGKKKKKEEQDAATQTSGSVSMSQTTDQSGGAQTTAASVSAQNSTGITASPSVPPNAGSTTTTVTTTTSNPAPNQPAGVPPATATPPVPGSPSKDSALEKRAGMDILSRLTQRSNKALVAGVGKAKELQVQYVDSEHVLWGLIQDAGIYQLFSELKVTPTDVVQAVEKQFQRGKSTESPKFSPRVKKVLELSFSEARALGYEFISPEHVLAGLIKENEGVAAQVLRQFGITEEKLKGKVAGKKDKKEEEQDATGEFALDLTQQAREGKLDPVVARSKEIERIMHILSRRTKNNPVLVGDAGVGKTAVVEGLAQRIVSGNVPETLKNRRILSLDLTSLIAGASHRGEFEKRFKQLLEEIKASHGQIILFIDEIHNMVGAGGSGGTMDASNILKPSLARGEVQTIGATTVTEYRKYIEKDRALERRFQQVLIQEPSQDNALLMIRALKDKYEAFHKVSITDDAMHAAVRLSARYVGDRSLPDKAVDLIDEAASLVKLPAISLPEEIQALDEKNKRLTAEKDEARAQNNQIRERTIEREMTKVAKELEEKRKEYEIKKGQTTSSITPDIIQQVVSDWTGIPISRLTESETEKLISLEKIIHKRLIDQEHAVSAVSEAVRRGRAGLATRKRPIGSFIFMGPTGVGKTELAKVLAEELFGSADMMVRLDMTEYMEKHEVAKLIGAPPGYVGYEEGGQLTEAVRKLPYSVVLLDEIEKAHPDVFNILLQILDDGRLTDNKGRTISFKNTILICTSNLGSGKIQEVMMKGMKVGAAPVETPEEQPISTYTISPTGREIVTKTKDVWEKDEKQSDASRNERWMKRTLADYFKGQKINVTEELKETYELPENGFDTHVVLPSGEELVTYGHRALMRKSTIAKEWDYNTLLDAYSEHTVSNAHPDKPDEQFPTASWQTHAVSPAEKEFVGVDGQLWVRENLTVPLWRTLSKEDYLKETAFKEKQEDQSADTQKPSEEDPNTPSSLDDVKGVNPAVAADMPSTSAIASAGNTPPNPVDGMNGSTPPTQEVQEGSGVPSSLPNLGQTTPMPASQTPSPTSGNAKGASTEPNVEANKAPDEPVKTAGVHQKGSSLFRAGRVETDESAAAEDDEEKKKFAEPPTDHWDVHLFTPDGKEIIIVGKHYWMRIEASRWEHGKLYKLLSGDNAPVLKDEMDAATDEADELFNKLAEKLLEELRTFFRPELINRFDEVVVFRPLQAKHMMAIVDLQLTALEKGLEEQEFGLEVTKEAREELSVEGFDPVFGARPLRRTIQRLVENPISTMLIKGKLAAGDTIVIDYDVKSDEFVFNVTRPAPNAGQTSPASTLPTPPDGQAQMMPQDTTSAQPDAQSPMPDQSSQSSAPTPGVVQPGVAGETPPPGVQAQPVDDLSAAMSGDAFPQEPLAPQGQAMSMPGTGQAEVPTIPNADQPVVLSANGEVTAVPPTTSVPTAQYPVTPPAPVQMANPAPVAPVTPFSANTQPYQPPMTPPPPPAAPPAGDLSMQMQ